MPLSAPRYAIYFVPPAQSPLYRLGTSVLGYDNYRAERVPFPPDLDHADWPDITDEPRRYGFHATLKAPFYLAAGTDEAGLVAALAEFARTLSPFEAGSLSVQELGGFIALVPESPSPPLHALADACVRSFEQFRAPLGDNDRVRRLASGLSERQIKHLDRWGYPFVFEDYRFHMTLTGALPDLQRKKTLARLRAKFDQAKDALKLSVDQIVVARQGARTGAFKIISAASCEGGVTIA